VACVFCGSPERSREHVIAQWLDGPLRASQRSHGTGAPPSLGATMTNRWTPIAGSEHQGRDWTSAGPDLVTTALCQKCNNHWLNSMETAARPFLERMVTGRPVSLESTAQRTMAQWSYKTALLMQLVRPANVRVVPGERYRAFYANERPPADARVWLGAVEGGPAVHEASTVAKLNSPTSEAEAWVTIISIGHLLVVCAGRRVVSDGPLRWRAASEGRAFLPVWPASVRALAWPPPDMLRDLDLRDLGTMDHLF
jgi:hypothetical protein